MLLRLKLLPPLRTTVEILEAAASIASRLAETLLAVSVMAICSFEPKASFAKPRLTLAKFVATVPAETLTALIAES